MEPTLKKIAAQVDGPCLGYFGSGGARCGNRCFRVKLRQVRRAMHTTEYRQTHLTHTPRDPKLKGLELAHTGGAAIMSRWCTTASTGDMQLIGEAFLLLKNTQNARGCRVRRRTALEF